MNSIPERPADTRITLAPVDLPILFPESEGDAKLTYLLSGPKAAFAKVYDRASKGVANAQALLGSIYLNGWVDGKCLPEDAQFWGEKSAKQDNAYGQWVLAWANLEQDKIGDGMSAMFDSADQSFAPALYHLGLFHIAGIGIQKDEELGFAMLRTAAQQGHEMSIRTIEHYSRIGRLGIWPAVRAIILTPLLRPLRYVNWILFKKKFAEDRLSYVRSLFVENAIRRKYGGSFVGLELEDRLRKIIEKHHQHS
ncbi:MAG: tetratricopeptide repeat protein [Bacteroidota bacterium]